MDKATFFAAQVAVYPASGIVVRNREIVGVSVKKVRRQAKQLGLAEHDDDVHPDRGVEITFDLYEPPAPLDPEEQRRKAGLQLLVAVFDQDTVDDCAADLDLGQVVDWLDRTQVMLGIDGRIALATKVGQYVTATVDEFFPPAAPEVVEVDEVPVNQGSPEAEVLFRQLAQVRARAGGLVRGMQVSLARYQAGLVLTEHIRHVRGLRVQFVVEFSIHTEKINYVDVCGNEWTWEEYAPSAKWYAWACEEGFVQMPERAGYTAGCLRHPERYAEMVAAQAADALQVAHETHLEQLADDHPPLSILDEPTIALPEDAEVEDQHPYIIISNYGVFQLREDGSTSARSFKRGWNRKRCTRFLKDGGWTCVHATKGSARYELHK